MRSVEFYVLRSHKNAGWTPRQIFEFPNPLIRLEHFYWSKSWTDSVTIIDSEKLFLIEGLNINYKFFKVQRLKMDLEFFWIHYRRTREDLEHPFFTGGGGRHSRRKNYIILCGVQRRFNFFLFFSLFSPHLLFSWGNIPPFLE